MMAINLATLSVSRHVREERWERITECVKAVGGLGEVVFTSISTKAKYADQLVVNCVTSTGLVFVVNVTKNTLITGYLGSIRYVQGLYGSQGLHRLPDTLFATIKSNEKKFYYLYSI